VLLLLLASGMTTHTPAACRIPSFDARNTPHRVSIMLASSKPSTGLTTHNLLS
jgi:hypothetical protein